MFHLMWIENIRALNELFKRNTIILNNNLPKSWFNLGNLIVKDAGNLNLLQNFTKLKSLSIKNMEINEKYLQNLIQLEKLKLQTENINLTNLKFPNLRKLSLNLTNVEMTDDFVKNLTQLTCLKLKLSDEINFDWLTCLINLKELKLCCETLNCNFLQNLINLEHLTINGNNCKVTDENLINLTKLKKLKLYNFHRKSPFEGNCFKYFINLEKFSCDSLQIKEENLKYLTTLKKLKLNKQNINSGKFLKYLTQLEQLKFELEESFKEKYLKNLNNVKYLNVKNSETFTGQNLINLTNLTKLNVSYTNINDEHLVGLQNLKSLNLNVCNNITGTCLQKLINLTDLKIECTDVTENYLMKLTNLKLLNINNCTKILYGNFLLNMNSLEYFNYCDFEFCKDKIQLFKLQYQNQLEKKTKLLYLLVQWFIFQQKVYSDESIVKCISFHCNLIENLNMNLQKKDKKIKHIKRELKEMKKKNEVLQQLLNNNKK
ncbi:hypothetical protein ABK040_011456 [Willaertia magna]